MNLTVFLIILSAGFIGSVLGIRYVPDSRKVSLLFWFGLAGLALGLTIPPKFNDIVFAVAVVMGGVPVLSRLTSDLIERWRVARAAKRFMGGPADG